MVKLSLRIWILIIALVLSALAISPTLKQGIMIKSVEQNSTAFNTGLRQGQVITHVNEQRVETIEDYSNIINDIFQNTNESQKVIIQTEESEFILLTNAPPTITLGRIPSTNLRTGLDLRGGARALVQPSEEISRQELNDAISIINERLNVFGISDVVIRPVSDLAGNNFILVELAGATPSDLEELISQQGKFEAKIGNETVFTGGNEDVTRVCRNDATCAGIDRCIEVEGGQSCRFRFVIFLNEKAAQRHADITRELGVNITEQGRYLEKKLDLYLDDNLVDSLFISEDLRGKVTTQIQIQGWGSGATREEAIQDALGSMNKLQTILITGSLPFKLEIVKLDTISPLLGENFIFTIFLAGIAAILGVGLIVFVRYRSFKSSLALLFTVFSEVLIILGVAALIKWNLDLPSIAGILAVIGTGVDQQIVILDESRLGKKHSMKERLKRALFVIVSAYFTSLVSLLPLYWAGAGLLKGFAVTTIIGITSAVLITRPAFADIVKKIEE